MNTPAIRRIHDRSHHGCHAWRGAIWIGLALLAMAAHASTENNAQAGLACEVATDVTKNLFWNTDPVLSVRVANHTTSAAEGLRCAIRVEDQYYQREVWAGTVEFPAVAPGQRDVRAQTIPVPFGVHTVRWALSNAQGALGEGTIDIAKMMAPCYREELDPIRAYERRWGLFGGVWGFYSPDLATDMGTRWIRYEDTTWATCEIERGRFEMAPLLDRLDRYARRGIECIVFQTLYQHPKFYQANRPDFAPGYGEMMRRAAQAARGLSNCFELGNEDNGPTKLVYSEVARQASAGIRAEQPHALIANSGTAYVDLSWLRMQADRRVMDGLDVVCTHPYTAGTSPEAWNVLGQLSHVDELIDDLGGMMVQWTTEFGWEHTFNQQRRAEWIPRHYAIGAMAGVERHGLYTWERDFGVFQGTAQPPAASVHALAKMIEGHRFLGVLERTESLWACVFERAGDPVAMAWAPNGQAQWAVEVTGAAQAHDLFGNPLAAPIQDGRFVLDLAQAPVYIHGVAETVLAKALANRSNAERERLVACLKKSGLAPGSPWEALANDSQITGATIRKALLTWQPSATPITRGEQAVVAQALRCYMTVGRFDEELGAPATNRRMKREAFRDRLTRSVEGDVDIPSLRYLLERWDRLADEERMARDSDAATYADRLVVIQEVLAALCEQFATSGERRQFALWPYLYTLAEDGQLRETLRFVPGDSTAIKVRLNSYSKADRPCSVSLQLPEGWTSEPEALQMTAKVGAHAEGEIRVHCPATTGSEHVRILAVVRSEGLPDRAIPFDDVVIEAPVRVTLDPVRGALAEAPLILHLANAGSTPLTGVLRLLIAGDTRALARVPFTDLAPETSLTHEIRLASLATRAGQDWPLTANLILNDGRKVDRPLTLDFACAARADVRPLIDGDCQEWSAPFPLRLDKIEYAKGSFGTQWSPEDLSAVTYTMWDDAGVYFAARVKDQTFNQNLAGASVWIQDSIQIGFARDEKSAQTEFALALTPAGPEVACTSLEKANVPGSQLAVRLEQGAATYEAMIPWSAMDGLATPKAGDTIRFTVLVNDDDAITGRRFLERYGGIAHDKNIANFGYLTLLAGAPRATLAQASAAPALLFQEDFEEYQDGTIPDTWQSIVHLAPAPDTQILAGAGRDGSKALVLTNTIGEKPCVYRNLVRSLDNVLPGHAYALHCWMRGSGVGATAGIIGVCSDVWGNEAFSYAEHGQVVGDWQEVVFKFSGPAGGRLNLIIRNNVKIDELAIDDITIAEEK